MEYLEIIELRSSQDDCEKFSQQMIRFVDDLKKENVNYEVKLFRCLIVETDWSFHIRVKSETKFTSPSPLSLRLVAALKEFGLVHHSIWLEIK
jgi:hypothetical protein